jgi:hypothetical protein
MQQIQKRPISEFAIASLTLGILSFLQIGGLEKGIAAIVFGILSLRKIARPDSNARGEGLAAAGIVLGIIYAIIGSIALITLIKNPELLQEILKRPSLPR